MMNDTRSEGVLIDIIQLHEKIGLALGTINSCFTAQVRWKNLTH
jgi:hypothetical protein